MQYRYVMLVALCLFLPAAHALVVSWRSREKIVRATAAGVGVAGFAWLVVMSGDLTYQMLFDARYQAVEWLRHNTHPGERLGFYGGANQLAGVPPGVVPDRIDGVQLNSGPERLAEANVDILVVSPDHSSRSTGQYAPFVDRGLERSVFLPESILRGVKDGSLGFHKVADFETASLIGRPVKYMPFVNPRVQIFRRTANRSSSANR